MLEDIDKNMSTTRAAEVISDIAMSTSSTIQVLSSWISSGRAKLNSIRVSRTEVLKVVKLLRRLSSSVAIVEMVMLRESR